MQNSSAPVNPGLPGAGRALALLLAINLFNYLDRQVLAAVEPHIRATFFDPGDLSARAKTGALATAFLLSYMVMAPVFGWLADRFSRWLLIAVSVALWSLASAWTGLAATFAMLLLTRVFVGVGEAGYGPAAPTLISDLYPAKLRGQKLSLFYLAIPVGSALGYVYGGAVSAWLDWRWAFYLVAPPGLILAALCLWMRDPRTQSSSQEAIAAPKPRLSDYLALFRIRSYTINSAAMTAMTFAIGGMSFWMPSYIADFRKAEFAADPNLLSHVNTRFGAITVVAGLLGTLLGGWTADRLRPRFPSAYFLVSGIGILLAFPATVALLHTPFPSAWGLVFLAVFFLFFNTGPANAALANVTPAATRSTAFALNIFLIHALGDAISPPLIGAIGDRWNMNTAFGLVSAMMVVAGGFWLYGTRHLAADTAAVESSTQ
jgi:MFS family permease